MRVVVVSDYADNSGGSHRVAVETCLALAEAGLKVDLVHAGDAIDGRLERSSVSVRAIQLDDATKLGPVEGALSYLWSVPAYRACRNLFASVAAKREPTLVHVHSFSRCFSPSVFRAAKSLGLPVVLSLHDYFAFSSNGLHYDFSRDALQDPRQKERVWKCTDRRFSYHLLRSMRMQIMQRLQLMSKGVDHFVAVSRVCGDVASRSVLGDKVTVVYSPVEGLTGIAQPWRNSNVVYVGRLSKEKGVTALARAAYQAGVSIRFVGDGIEAASIREQNPDAVITGWLAPEGVRQELLQARALVLPSRWQETFGICVPEAQSLGVPVAVSRLAGSAEWVQNGVNGFVFNPYSPGELVQILRGFQDDALVRRMGTAAREHFGSLDTSAAKYAAELTSVYERVMVARDMDSEAKAA